MPEWVHVWFWLRFLRGVVVMTPLPQQGFDPEAMSTERYEDFRNEWVNVGEPKTSLKQVVAVMSSGKIDTDQELPF